MVEALGLGSILLWQWLTVLKGPLLVPSPGTFFEDPRVGYVYFSLVLCGTLLVLTRWGPSLRERGFRPLLWGCAGVMSLAWLPWGEALRTLASWGPFLQIGLPAVGSVVLLVSWEWRLTSAPFFLQSSVFGGACVLRTGLILLVSLALPSLLVPLATTLPFLAALLWSPPGKASGSPPPSEGQPPSFPLRLALRAGSFFLLSALFLSLLLDRRNPSMGLAEVFCDPLYTLGALGVGFSLRVVRGLDLRRIYHGAEIFLALGFLAFAALGEGRPLVPLGLLQLGAGIFGAYVFTLILYLGGRAGRVGALSVVATGQLVVSGSMLAGMVLTKVLESQAHRWGIPPVLTSSLLGMGLLFFSSLFFRDDRDAFAGYDLKIQEPKTEAPSAEEREEELRQLGHLQEEFARRRARIALLLAAAEDEPREETPEPSPEEDRIRLQLLKGELSRQEIRVALLVAQGQTNEEIARQLNITANTLRTHLRNIHRKLGSSSRGELLDQLCRREN